MSIYIWDKEIKNLYAWWSTSINDMQWPAPDGFHVPLTTEWQWLKTIMDWLSLTTWDDWRINLHMPFAGERSDLDASLDSQGGGGHYWSSSPYLSERGRMLYLNSSNVSADSSVSRASGSSVRCFKDSYAAPTSDVEILAWPISSGSIAPSTQWPTLSLWTATKSCTCVISWSLYSGGAGWVTFARLYKNWTQVAVETYGSYWTKNFEMQVSVVPGDVLTLGTERGSSQSWAVNDVYVSSPDWIVINGAVWYEWIFRNKANGLISITSDWDTWYTIQDKNLWATAVYNDWDTLTQANMWNMYQRWNNYWFPSTWVVPNVSYKQVDASGYWPWNYYSNDAFIIWIGDRSSVQNDNLRWWVSQWTSEKAKEAKAVYLWENKVRPTGYYPWANTLAYYKFDWNLNDSSGNGRNLSLAWWSVTYWAESQWGKYAYMDSSTYTNNYASMPYNSTNYTINRWYKRVWSVSWNYWIIADFHTGNNYFPRLKVQNSAIWFIVSRSDVSASGTDSWNNYCISISNWTATCYRNWTQVASYSVNSFSWNLQYFRLNTVWYQNMWYYYNYTGIGRLSEFILENKARAAQEVADYYNSTKWNYWLT